MTFLQVLNFRKTARARAGRAAPLAAAPGRAPGSVVVIEKLSKPCKTNVFELGGVLDILGCPRREALGNVRGSHGALESIGKLLEKHWFLALLLFQLLCGPRKERPQKHQKHQDNGCFT